MKKAVNVVPTHKELNAMLARTPAEETLFNNLDAELQWPQIPLGKPPSLEIETIQVPRSASGRPLQLFTPPAALFGVICTDCRVRR